MPLGWKLNVRTDLQVKCCVNVPAKGTAPRQLTWKKLASAIAPNFF